MALEIITKINLDMKAPNAEIVYGNQYDSAGYVNAQLLNDGEKWPVPSGAVAVVSYYKSDRIGGYYDTTSKGETAVAFKTSDRSLVTIALDEQTLTTFGNVSVQINFYQNEQRLSTFSFILNVKKSPITASNIDSKWFGNLLILSGIVIDDTFRISGAAPDSLRTGNRFTQIENDVASGLNLKVNKPVQSPNGEAGQLLKTLGDGRTEWVTQGTPTDEQVGTAIESWLNNHPEATTTVEDGTISAKKLTNNLQVGIFSKAFYDVTDYGIEPNSENDIYEALFDLLHNIVHPNGGGVVFFPAGHYILSDTIMIPDNTTFMGVGKETSIYFTGEYGFWGTGLGNGGDNVTIRDMKIDHTATDNIKTVRNQSNFGGIGFSTAEFECQTYYHQTISPSTNIPRREMHGFKAINIWSDSTYVLQVEPESRYGVSDVLYENIYAPNSLVSIHPHENDGFVHDVTVKNVTCGLFRCGVGYHNAKNITIENLQCSEIFAPDGNCSFENVRISPDIDPEWAWSSYTVLIGDKALFRDVTIEKGEQFARAIGNGSENELLFENVKIYGFSNIWANEVSTPGPASFINCDFDGGYLFVVKGFAINCNASFGLVDTFNNHDTHRVLSSALVKGDKVEDGRWNGNGYVIPYTDLVFVQGYINNVSTTLATDDTLFTLPEALRPTGNRSMPAMIALNDGTTLMYVVTINANGIVQQKLSSTARGVYFSGIFTKN